MNDILALLQPIQNSVSKTTIRQLSRLIPAMIAITGRITMLGLSRWTVKGGSYRTIQRFFNTVIPLGTGIVDLLLWASAGSARHLLVGGR
jgi:hypothetical protein